MSFTAGTTKAKAMSMTMIVRIEVQLSFFCLQIIICTNQCTKGHSLGNNNMQYNVVPMYLQTTYLVIFGLLIVPAKKNMNVGTSLRITKPTKIKQLEVGFSH